MDTKINCYTSATHVCVRDNDTSSCKNTDSLGYERCHSSSFDDGIINGYLLKQVVHRRRKLYKIVPGKTDVGILEGQSNWS